MKEGKQEGQTFKGIDALFELNTKGDLTNKDKDRFLEPTKRSCYITSVTNAVTSNPDILLGKFTTHRGARSYKGMV